jgi:hypothetical protein
MPFRAHWSAQGEADEGLATGIHPRFRPRASSRVGVPILTNPATGKPTTGLLLQEVFMTSLEAVLTIALGAAGNIIANILSPTLSNLLQGVYGRLHHGQKLALWPFTTVNRSQQPPP